MKATKASEEDKYLIFKMFVGVETERLNVLLREKTKEIEALHGELSIHKIAVKMKESLEREL
jgi:hypothetical protein